MSASVAVVAVLLISLVACSQAPTVLSSAPAAGGFGAGGAPASAAGRSEKPLALPDEASALDGLRPGHPRLILTPADVVSLRERIATDTATASMYADVKARAEGLLSTPVLTYEKPEGSDILQISRAALERIYTLGLVWLVDQDPAIAGRGAAELEAVSAFPDWNPIHFLDTGEMSHAVAIGYDWLYDSLTPTQRTDIAAALVAKGLSLARDAYTGVTPIWLAGWALTSNNWALVTNGGLTLAALAVADEYPALARLVISGALVRVPAAMAHYAPDGGFPEGMAYWTYAGSYAVYLFASLDSALGTDFGLSGLPGFSFAGDMPLHLAGPTGELYNFADYGQFGIALSVPFLFWTAERFGRPQDRAYELDLMKTVLTDGSRRRASATGVIWYRPSESPVPVEPLDRLFTGIDVAAMRGSWEDRNAWWVGVKGGNPSISHNQLDAGSFVLEAQGERWAIDLGAEKYNVPGYFESPPGGRRWTYFRSRAESHNALVLDPDACEDQDPTAVSVITRFRSAPSGAFTITDLTGAYRGTPVRRGVGLLDERSRVVVQDELSPTSPTELWWFMHTRAEVEVVDGGRTAMLTQGGKTLRASLVGLPGAVFSATDASPMPTSPTSPNSPTPGVRRLAVTTTIAGPTSYAVVFDDGSGAVPTTVTSLDAWQVDGAEQVSAVDREPRVAAPAPNPCKNIAGPTTTLPTDVFAPPPGLPISVSPAFTG